MRRPPFAVVILAVIGLGAAAFAGRHDILRATLSMIANLASGYHVTFADQHLGTSHGALLDVHVTSADGEPVLDAARIDVWYRLRDLLPGSRHRYGISAVAIDRPTITIVKHRDGSYNLRAPQAAAAGPAAPAEPNGVPIAMTVRVRDASGSLQAPYAVDPSARTIGVRDVSLDATIDTSARTQYRLDGFFAEVVPQPFHVKGAIDVVRGYAMHHAYAGALPLRAIGNFLIDQQTSRILSGTASHFDARAYALNVLPNAPVNYHVGAAVDVRAAAMMIPGLDESVEGLSGRLQLVDDVFFAHSLRGSISGVPVNVHGALFRFAAPQFRLGIDGTGDLSALRRVFGFSRDQPVAGGARVGALIEGPLGNPAIIVRLDAPWASYRGVALHAAHAFVGVGEGMVTLAPVVLHAGGAAVTIRGALQLGAPVTSDLVARVTTPADALPYAGELLGKEPLLADVVLHGRDTQFGGSGAVVSAVNPSRATAIFALAPGGVLDVEPFWIHTASGDLDGRYVLDRVRNRSAFWLAATNLTLRAPAAPSAFDAVLPRIPAVDATIERSQFAGGGPSGSAAALAGTLRMRDARIAGVDISALNAGFAGSVNGVAAPALSASGPWGSIAGNGSFSGSGFAIAGLYTGTLQGLRPYLGNVPAAGDLAGPVSLAYQDGVVTVQARGLKSTDGQVRGIPVRGVDGTARIANGLVRVYSAHAGVAGGDAVAAGAYDAAGAGADALHVVATHLDGAALHGIGVPLSAGTVDATGRLAAGSPLPHFDGAVAIRDARAGPFRVGGTSVVSLAGDAMSVTHAVAGLDGTYAALDGRISSLTSGTPAYALSAVIGAGDVAQTLHAFNVNTYPTSGVYSAQFDLRGDGLNPSVRGPFAVPAGSINGMPFTNLQTDLSADRAGAIARRGSVVVGTTRVAFAAGIRPAISGVLARTPNATLSDFDDFFDTGDTLAGNGSVRFDLISQRSRLSTNGAVDVNDFRYHTLPFGNARATWSSARNVLRGSLEAGGDRGLLRAAGTVDVAPSYRWQQIVTASRYDAHAQLAHLDVSYWLAALGFPDVPISGRVDGSAQVKGSYPNLALVGSAAMQDGSLFRLPVNALGVTVRGAGGRLHLDRGELDAPGLTATASGSFGLRGSDALDVNVYARTAELPRVLSTWTRASVPVTGTFEATAHVTGSYGAPVVAGAFDAIGVNAYGIAVPSLFGSARLAGGRLELRNAGATFEHGDASLAGTLPLQIRPFGIGPADAPVSFDLAVNDLDPAFLNAFAGSHTRLGGRINGAVGIGGTVRAPRISGDFGIENGSYVSDLDRTPISRITARLLFNRTEASVEGLSARLGSGSVDGHGRITFPASSNGLTFTVTAQARNAQLDLPSYGRGSLTGEVSLAKTGADAPTLSGDADLSDAVIPFAAFLGLNRGAGASTSASPLLPFDVAFDLGLRAGRNVRVRGSGYGAGLDIGATGAVRLGGDLKAPSLEGRFDATSGTLTYFDRAFRVQSAEVVFNKGDGLLPVLHATGTSHVVNPDPDRVRNPYGSADITINVDGPVDNLKVAFDSNPPGYSKEQIIALIAPFGGFIGGVGFDPVTAGGQGAGTAPGTQPLPGLLGPTNYGTISLSQEAFNILNAQFTAGIFSPVETALSQGLGFNEVSLTVDYYGNVGFSARKQLGRFVNLVYGSTFGLPSRQSYGLQYAPSDVTTAQLSFFFESGPQRLFDVPSGGGTTNARLTTGLPLVGQSGFSFTLQRLFW